MFHNSNTGRPYTDARYMTNFWNKHLQNANVRHRGINQCRHTFASRLLTTGRYPEKMDCGLFGAYFNGDVA